MDSHVKNCVLQGDSRVGETQPWMAARFVLCSIFWSFTVAEQPRSHRSSHRSCFVRCERLTGPVKTQHNNYSATNKHTNIKSTISRPTKNNSFLSHYILHLTHIHTHAHTQIWVKTVVRAPSPPPSLRTSHNSQTAAAAATVNHKYNKENKNSRTLSIHLHHHHHNNNNNNK